MEDQRQAPLMAGTDSRKQLLTLIRDFAAEKSQGGEWNFSSVVSLRKCWKKKEERDKNSTGSFFHFYLETKQEKDRTS